MSQSVSIKGAGTPSSVRLVDADHDPPVGVATERVDPHTLEAIQLLFKEKGLQFFAVLLRLAIAKQCPLPGFADATACAVITARSIRELSKRVGWGYDTTEKYLVILCALHLLYKGKSPDGIVYYFPLCRYHPPAGLETLEEIIADYRPKVASFGRKVKRRFVVYLGQQQKSPISAQPALASAPSFDLSGALQDIEQIMQQALGDGTLPHQLLVQIKGALRYRCQHAEATGDLGDFPPAEKSPVGPKTGDFSSNAGREKSSFSETGDFSIAVATRNRRLPAQSGDFSPAPQTVPEQQKSPVSSAKGDSRSTDSSQNGRLPAQTGNSSSQMGDSAPEQVPNVNVILRNLVESLNDNDKSTVIEFLRIIFDEAPRKRGYYHNLYKNYKRPDAWLAAAIETLIAYRAKKTTTDPGKYFYDLCVTFHQQGIPTDVAEHVQQYSFLPYGELLAVLGRTIPARSPAALTTRVPTRLVKVDHRPIVPQMPREKDRVGMPLPDAKRGAALLKSNMQTCQLQVAGYRQTDGSCVLLVDDEMQRPRQRWIYSLQDLQHRLASMKTLNDFFEQEERR